MLSSFVSRRFFNQNITFFSKPAIRFFSSHFPQSSLTTSSSLSTSSSISNYVIRDHISLEGSYKLDGQVHTENDQLSCPSSFPTLVSYDFTNRNAREPRRNNQGARPCSSVRRRRKIKRRANDHPFIPLHRSRRPKGYDI